MTIYTTSNEKHGHQLRLSGSKRTVPYRTISPCEDINARYAPSSPRMKRRRVMEAPQRDFFEKYYPDFITPVNTSIKKEKKSVTFSNFASVIVRSITPEALKANWLQPVEYAEIERQRRSTVRAVMRVRGDLRKLSRHEYCLKGLEQLLVPQQLMARKETNNRYRRLVISEHRFQKKQGFSDPEAIRQLSLLFSKQSTHQARFRASVDPSTMMG